jgi:KRAB domain-containing zinc finger protein
VVNCETRVCSDLGLKSLIDLNLMKMSVKCVNEMIVNKVRLLSKCRDNNEMFSHFEDLLVKRDLNNCNNCVKMCRISTECKALEENEDKLKCNKQLKCFSPKCRFSAITDKNLNKHISQHLNKRQFICNECNKGFNQKSNLNVHKQRIHSNDRPFVCPVSECGKRFKTKEDLIRHKAIHSDEKPFKCDVKDCDKSTG